MPDYTCAQALKQQFELLMVPGGRGTWPLVDQPPVLEWLRTMDAKVSIMASVCTGAALLAKAGLLDGKPAATNHGAFGRVAQQGPRVLWDGVSSWVDAGKYVTSAGVSAGTDLGFYLVCRLAGRAVAEIAVQGAEYDWHRDPQAPIFYPQQAAVPVTPDKS
jgi:putative intracellular protease/amidase